MKFYIVVAILLSLMGCASTQQKTADITAQEYNWSDSIDYSALRKKIGWGDNYDALCSGKRPTKTMTEAMNNEKWKAATVMGERWLQQCPIDIRIHYYMAISLEYLDRKNEVENHIRWMKGFMDDVLASGDGESCETAYEVIAVSEEYDALYILGLEAQSQALVSSDSGIACDFFKTLNREGKEIPIYFNPAAHFVRMEKLFK